MSAAAPLRLDVARARRLTEQLRGSADLTLDLVVEAYDGRAWEVLGHPSWSAYVAAEVPQLAIIGKGLPLEQRRDAVAMLRGRGLSLRGVSEVLGIAPNTVRADAAAAGVQLAEVIGLDGVRHASSSSSSTPRRRRRAVPLTDRVVVLLAAAAEPGLTAREVARELHQPQHIVAPALVRLTQSGRVVYRRPERRGLFGTYAPK